VLPGPARSVPHRAASPPHPAANDRAPSRPGPHISRIVPRRPDPAALHCRAATPPPAPAGYRAVPPSCSGCPRSPPVRLHPSPDSPNPPSAASPPAPFKKGTSPLPSEFSLHRVAIPPLHSNTTPAAPFPFSRPPPRRSPESLLPDAGHRPYADTLPARRHPGTPSELADSILPPASPHHAASSAGPFGWPP
jgi:hypothetical protein